VLITDVNLQKIYSSQLQKYKRIVIPTGEDSKNWDTVVSVYRELLNIGASRNIQIIGFGGGVVCDIAGFVADTFMRGCSFGLVATSLLAQVDAAIGGKNGFNLDGVKNLIGTIRQPDFVVCDPLMLKTLPIEELKSGLGEVVKYALIADPDLFSYLLKNTDKILDVCPEVYEHLIESCVHIKAGFVEKDEQDRGVRNHLNFGHTFGHAIEQIEHIPHGIAVAKGMLLVIRMSIMLNYCKVGLYHQVVKLFKLLSMPDDFTIHNTVMQMVRSDKKKQNSEEIRMVFIRDIGDIEVQSIRFSELEKILINL
jgi:3-dehydroquinate synthase